MKHQYFADRRDFYKYELLLDLVEGHPLPWRLLSILMLTPDDESGEGDIIEYSVGVRRPELFRFLKCCRSNGHRHLSSLRPFMEQVGVDYRPLYDDQYFYDSTRSAYIDECAKIASDYPLIFFDPDIGLETGTRSYMQKIGIEKYLMYSDVETIVQASALQSVIVVYQHLQRDKRRIQLDLESKCRCLCRTVGSRFATFLTDLEVAFLITSRDSTSNTWARDLALSHGAKHNLHSGEIAQRPAVEAQRILQLRDPPKRTTMVLDIQTARIHVSNRNGRQVMVRGLQLRSLGYRKGAKVEVTDADENPNNEAWRYTVSNNEHSTLVSRDPAPPDWIQHGVLIEIRVHPPDENVDLPVETSNRVGESATNPDKSVTASDLAEWRRSLISVLNELEGATRWPDREGLAARISRLTRTGRIPREVGSFMRVVTEMRNQTEYEQKVLTASESNAVSAAWKEVTNWASRCRLDV